MGAKKKNVQQQHPRQARGAPSFCKVMLGDCKRRLRVPPSFTRHLMGKAPCEFTLHSSIPGRAWHVQVEREADELFFYSGWQRFLKDHMIETGDFLVFRYDGNLGFNVHVYGTDGCMKDIFASDDNKGKLRTRGAAQMTVHPGQQINNKELVVSVEPEPLRRGRMPPVFIGSEKALEEALSFKPERPYFVATWRQSRAYGMTIPSSLVEEFEFGRREHTTLRDYLGRLWPIEIITQRDGRVLFGTGWSKFSRGNHLTEGDACVFEFIKEGDIIQTHIFKMEKGTGKVIKQCGLPASQRWKDSSARRLASGSQRESALQTARSFRPPNSHPYHLLEMTVPVPLLIKHDLMSKTSVSLHDPCGRKWHAKVRRRGDSRVDLRGIGPFFRGDNLENGDACVFEFCRGR